MSDDAMTQSSELRPGIVPVRVDRLLAFAVLDADLMRAHNAQASAERMCREADAAMRAAWDDLTRTEQQLSSYPTDLEASCAVCGGCATAPGGDDCEECW